MKITEALKQDATTIRVSNGRKWLIWNGREWVVMEQRYAAKSVIVLYSGESEDDAIEELTK